MWQAARHVAWCATCELLPGSFDRPQPTVCASRWRIAHVLIVRQPGPTCMILQHANFGSLKGGSLQGTGSVLDGQRDRPCDAASQRCPGERLTPHLPPPLDRPKRGEATSVAGYRSRAHTCGPGPSSGGASLTPWVLNPVRPTPRPARDTRTRKETLAPDPRPSPRPSALSPHNPHNPGLGPNPKL